MESNTEEVPLLSDEEPRLESKFTKEELYSKMKIVFKNFKNLQDLENSNFFRLEYYVFLDKVFDYYFYLNQIDYSNMNTEEKIKAIDGNAIRRLFIKCLQQENLEDVRLLLDIIVADMPLPDPIYPLYIVK